MQVYRKDPDATLDYTVDWSAWLATGDIIVSSDWVVPSGLTEVTDAHTQTSATVWLSGGVEGAEYLVTNRVTTDDGRIDDRTIVVRCVST